MSTEVWMGNIVSLFVKSSFIILYVLENSAIFWDKEYVENKIENSEVNTSLVVIINYLIDANLQICY